MKNLVIINFGSSIQKFMAHNTVFLLCKTNFTLIESVAVLGSKASRNNESASFFFPIYQMIVNVIFVWIFFPLEKKMYCDFYFHYYLCC